MARRVLRPPGAHRPRRARRADREVRRRHQRLPLRQLQGTKIARLETAASTFHSNLKLNWDNFDQWRGFEALIEWRTIPCSIAGVLPVSVMEEVRETLECETFNGAIRDTPLPLLLTISIIFVGAFAPAWKRRIEGACFYDVQNYLHAYPPRWCDRLSTREATVEMLLWYLFVKPFKVFGNVDADPWCWSMSN